MSKCLNCQEELQLNGKYCAVCGQKTSVGRLSFKTITADFFLNLFNLENKVWKTFRDIWVPAKLARAYVAGQRANYYNPIRLFLVSLFAFFALCLFEANGVVKQVDQVFETQKQKAWKKDLVLKFDTVATEMNLESDSLFQLKLRLFDLKTKIHGWENIELNDSFQITLDKIINSAPMYQAPRVPFILDSLKRIQYEREKPDTLSNVKEAYDPADWNIAPGINGHDFYNMNSTELVKKYGENKWYKKVLFIQLQKIVQNLDTSLKFFIGNAPWAIVLLLLLNAAFFKTIYFRRNYLFVEHFIFHLYGHTRLLFLGIAFILLSKLLSIGGTLNLIWWLAAAIYLFLGMKFYYRQSIPKTFIKFCLTVGNYILLLTVSFMLISGVLFLVL